MTREDQLRLANRRRITLPEWINGGKRNSRKSVRWSAVPVAPKLVHVRCEGERGSGPEGADDLCWAKI